MLPVKFEQFSRVLLTKMGVKFTNKESRFLMTVALMVIAIILMMTIFEQQEWLSSIKGSIQITNKAREAAKEGTPITLIDGNDLVRLVIKYELFITPVTTYVLDGFYLKD